MKKIKILAVGKVKEKYILDGIAEYAKRLSRFCEFSITEIEDIASADAVKKESDKLLAKMTGYCILLDLRGEQVSSEQLSVIIDKAFITNPELTFIVGGSDGVDARIRERAQKMVAFGKITFPHQLMRLVLTEQIYRALNISANTPYHK